MAAPEIRLRQVQVVRDYGMFERHEAPQLHLSVEAARIAAPTKGGPAENP